jgi:hypothetical protein
MFSAPTTYMHKGFNSANESDQSTSMLYDMVTLLTNVAPDV